MLNTGKTQTTLYTPDPAEYSKKLEIEFGGETLDTVKNPKILGLTMDPKLNYASHIEITQKRARKTVGVLKALTGTDWGKDKETISATYKAITRPQLEYASTIWSPVASKSSKNKLQVVQNSALRIATGHTRDTNVQHLHSETLVLPIEQHTQMLAAQTREKASNPKHPLNHLLNPQEPPRRMKETIFNSQTITRIQKCTGETVTQEEMSRNIKTLHTDAVEEYLRSRENNALIGEKAPEVDASEEELPRKRRRQLAQLRAGKSPLLREYLNTIDVANHPTSSCPMCGTDPHDTLHLFKCAEVQTTLTPWDLWSHPVEAAVLVERWEGLLGRPEGGGTGA
jgi:hypothetical protein